MCVKNINKFTLCSQHATYDTYSFHMECFPRKNKIDFSEVITFILLEILHDLLEILQPLYGSSSVISRFIYIRTYQKNWN